VRTLTFILLADSWARSLVKSFVRLGAFGPFLLEALDSSFLYLPLANELLLLALIHSGGPPWMIAFYAASGAAGSAVGVFLLDAAVRRTGVEGVERLAGRRQFGRLKRRLEAHAGRAVFVAPALPPPFPFRVTMMAASALEFPRGRMQAAVFGGRLLRFGAEGLLILYFGRGFIRLLESQAFEYVLYGLTAAAAAGTAYTLYRLFVGGRPRFGRP
jgi:membrane protein YqaA with SNARE-associated domain